MKLVSFWCSGRGRAIITWAVLNALLAISVVSQWFISRDSFSAWTAFQGFMTLNVAILALTKASFERTEIRLYLFDGLLTEKYHQSAGCQLDFLSVTTGPLPIHHSITEIYTEVHTFEKVYEQQENSHINVSAELLDQAGKTVKDTKAFALSPQSRFSILLSCDNKKPNFAWVVSGKLTILQEIVSAQGENKQVEVSLPFKTSFG